MATQSSSRLILPVGLLAAGLVIGWLSARSTSDTTTTPAAAPIDVDVLNTGERHRGEITSTSELNGRDGSRFERYLLSLEADSLIEFELSGALKGTLALYDTEGQFLSAAQYDEWSDGPTQLRQRITEEGDHMLVVSGNDAHSYGPFLLNSRLIESQDSGPLEIPATVVGWLQDGANTYELDIEESGLYTIEMRSDDIDAYLELSGPGNVALQDDDSAGNLDARISSFLEPGQYEVRARVSYGQGRGFYTLETATRELPSDVELQNEGELEFEQPLYGWFNGDERTYDLQVSETSFVTIDMMSDDFDAYLELDGEGIYLSNDDGGDGHNARITRTLPAGNYTITARGYSTSGSGLFTLEASASEVNEASGGELTVGETVSAQLESGAHDLYTFEATSTGLYVIDMMSEEVDPYLELQGNGLYLTDDDGGDGYNARLAAHLEAGEYTVIARAFSDYDAGQYSLRLTLEEE